MDPSIPIAPVCFVFLYFCIFVFLYFCNPCYYLGLCCNRWPPLCPTQIARIAQLSKIGCNIRTIFVPTPVRNAAKQEEISSFWEKKGKESILVQGSFCKANRSRGIPCCAATTTAGRVKLIKSSHHLPDFGQSYRWLVCRRSNGKCNIEDSRKGKNKESWVRYELENSKLLYPVCHLGSETDACRDLFRTPFQSGMICKICFS